jgi:hypothetical protein
MVHDYLATAFPHSPMAFARDFYDRFPKVALGTWPPGFYVLQLPWLVAVGSTPAQVLALITLLGGVCAWILALLLCRAFPVWLAVGVGFVFLFLPITVALSGAVMTEVPLALVTAIAVATWHRFLEQNRRAYAVMFGVIAGAGLLIKASVLGLTAIPVLTGPWFKQSRSSFVSRGIAVVLALLIGAPWPLYFRDRVRAGWIDSGPTLQHTLLAGTVYVGLIAQVLGWTVTVGVVAWLVKAAVQRRHLTSLEQTAASAVFGLLTVLLIAPSSLESRHLAPEILPLLILSTFGYQSMLGGLGDRFWRASLTACVIGLAAVESVAGRGFPTRLIHGYRQAVTQAEGACHADCVLLVISDANGEGALVSEAAQFRDHQNLRVLRGSKVLSSSDWAGNNFAPLVGSPEDFTNLVDRYGVDYVLVDSSPGIVLEAQLVATALAGDDFSVAFEVPVRRFVNHPNHRHAEVGQITVYRSHRPSASPRH